MTQQKVFALIIGIFFFSSLCKASENQEYATQKKPPITLVKKNRESTSLRPKTPDYQIVTCSYEDGIIYLTFAISEGTSTLMVTDESAQNYSYVIDTTPLDVSVITGTLIGTVCIELESESGNIFYGSIE